VVGIINSRGHFEEPDVDGRKILKYILEKWDMFVWNEFR
jgi:hypothetical protein